MFDWLKKNEQPSYWVDDEGFDFCMTFRGVVGCRCTISTDAIMELDGKKITGQDGKVYRLEVDQPQYLDWAKDWFIYLRMLDVEQEAEAVDELERNRLISEHIERKVMTVLKGQNYEERT